MPTTRQLLGAALVVVAAMAAAGVVAGVVWAALAPKVHETVGEVRLEDSAFQAGRYFVAEGAFAVLMLVCGVLAAVAARRWLRHHGWPLAVALAVGGVLTGVVAWRTGVWLGPDDPTARPLVVGEVVEQPLRLRSAGLLLFAAIAATAVGMWVATLGPEPGSDPDPAAVDDEGPGAAS